MGKNAMAKFNRNISEVVAQNLCTGCGTCAGICPFSAIKMIRHLDLFVPEINIDLCKNDKGCHVCYDVCPGHSIDLISIGKSLFSSNSYNTYLGYYRYAKTGHSSNLEVRFNAASGGVVTQLLIWMLQSGFINGAVVTTLTCKDRLNPEVIIATSTEEIISGQSSKYCPVPLNQIIDKIKKFDGKLAIVGLPCHIHGFRKAETHFSFLKRKIAVYIGLFCSSVKSFGATEYILKNYGIHQGSINAFTYRGEGCLGNMIIQLEDANDFKVPYSEYYPSIRSFFIPKRCSLCIDHTSELSDLSVGDIYIPPFSNDKIGTSSIIVRSKRGHQIIQQASHHGKLVLSDVDINLVIKSQWPMLEKKKHHIVVRNILNKMSGLKVPNYDYKFPRLNIKNWIGYLISSIILYSEIWIGRKRKLWCMIRFINWFAKKIGK